MVVNDIKIFQKIQKKDLLSIGKIFPKSGKTLLQQWRHKPSFITIVCYIYIVLPIVKIANTHFTFV